MSRESFHIAILFIVLFLLQTFVFNRMFFLGEVPMVYLLYLMLYPHKEHPMVFIVSSFLLGFLIDIFSDTSGVFATSALVVSYFRPYILNLCFGNNIDYQKLVLLNFSTGNRWLYISLIVLLHNTIFVFLEVFSFSHFFTTLFRLLISSFFSVFVCGLLVHLIERKK